MDVKTKTSANLIKNRFIGNVIEFSQLKFTGNINNFQRIYEEKALDNINKKRVLTNFILYFNVINLSKMTIIIVILVSLEKFVVYSVLLVMLLQIIYTILLIHNETRFSFIKKARFLIINLIMQEMSLCVFLSGAFLISLNSENIFGEKMLFIIEFTMTFFLGISILIEFICLMGTIFSFIFSIYGLFRKINFNCKKEKKTLGENEVLGKIFCNLETERNNLYSDQI